MSAALGILLLVAAAWAAYGGSLHAPFIFDDDATITRNPSIDRLWPLVGSAPGSGPLSPSPGLATSARPFVNLTLAFDRACHGNAPGGYRLTNLVIHVMAGLLLWRVLSHTLTRHRPQWLEPGAADLVSLGVALVWTVHPLNSECVMYLTQRTESLMALCFLATLACALQYWDAGGRARWCWLAAAGAASLVGMLSKEVMVVTPLVILLFERTFVSQDGHIHRASLPLHATLVVTALAVPLLYLLGFRTPLAGDVGIPLTTWWCTQAKVLFLYARLIVWPWPLALHYQMPYLRDAATAWPWIVAVAAFLLASAALAWRRFPAGFLAMAAVCTLAPTCLVPLFDEVAAERRLYLPLAGAVAGLLIAPFAIGSRPARLRDGRFIALLAATFLITCVLARVSRARAGEYRSAIDIWTRNVACQPDNYVARYNLAHSLVEAGRKAEAKPHYAHAATLPPPSPQHARIYARAAFNLALLHQESGDHESAVAEFRRVLALTPDSVDARYNMARSLEDLGLAPEAIEAYGWILDREPDHYWAHTNVGILLASRDETAAAIKHFEAAHRISSDFLACANLAAIYRAAGRIPDAIAMAGAALRAPRGPEDDELAAALADFVTQAGRHAIAPPGGSESNR